SARKVYASLAAEALSSLSLYMETETFVFKSLDTNQASSCVKLQRGISLLLAASRAEKNNTMHIKTKQQIFFFTFNFIVYSGSFVADDIDNNLSYAHQIIFKDALNFLH
ncbi:MAG TPA: hypothetical protein DC049_10210, partial [Spirochaetia bacterium]|nr:hypothetical protein [Spirochaetia bacterium]